MKKIVALVLALVLALSLATVAFAAADDSYFAAKVGGNKIASTKKMTVSLEQIKDAGEKNVAVYAVYLTVNGNKYPVADRFVLADEGEYDYVFVKGTEITYLKKTIGGNYTGEATLTAVVDADDAVCGDIVAAEGVTLYDYDGKIMKAVESFSFGKAVKKAVKDFAKDKIENVTFTKADWEKAVKDYLFDHAAEMAAWDSVDDVVAGAYGFARNIYGYAAANYGEETVIPFATNNTRSMVKALMDTLYAFDLDGYMKASTESNFDQAKYDEDMAQYYADEAADTAAENKYIQDSNAYTEYSDKLAAYTKYKTWKDAKDDYETKHAAWEASDDGQKYQKTHAYGQSFEKLYPGVVDPGDYHGIDGILYNGELVTEEPTLVTNPEKPTYKNTPEPNADDPKYQIAAAPANPADYISGAFKWTGFTRSPFGLALDARDEVLSKVVNKLTAWLPTGYSRAALNTDATFNGENLGLNLFRELVRPAATIKAIALVDGKLVTLANAVEGADYTRIAHTYSVDYATVAGKTAITKVYCETCGAEFEFVVGDETAATKVFGVGNYVNITNQFKDAFTTKFLGKHVVGWNWETMSYKAAWASGTGYTWNMFDTASRSIKEALDGNSLWISAAAAAAEKPVDTDVTSADTFDAGIALYAGMALMSVAGSAIVIGKKKEF